MKTSIKAIALATAASGFVMPASSQAADFQYDGVELSYALEPSRIDAESDEFDLKIGKIELNYSIKPNIVIGGAYASGKGDATVTDLNGTYAADLSISNQTVFAFYHADLNEKMAYKVGASYSKVEQKLTSARLLQSFKDENSGKGDFKSVIGGIRYQYSEKIEANLNVDYDLDADSDKFSYEVGARYQIRPDIDVSFNVKFHDGGRSPRISVKKYLDFSR